ncbi:hypothetical protein INR76_05895 [Marixanthomonas sp. SCSIO 43207]|uniref:hypothetical protein n=1 Tax=Marixanthomonas sp. SCSIO 43207 TaxID=2779360 RepID=UPI001CA88DB4|nr:hypothetical protein [Marixanthomonas sp. SCSIO 43207]UAB82291.1 hypothetical protein INR76_05895 [Marixanthomonas sp. SCSIO 43207]
MAISIDELFREFNLEYSRPIKWNEKFDADFSGVYIIALTDNPKTKVASDYNFEICPHEFDNWKNIAVDLKIQKSKIEDAKTVTEYFKKFWHKNENIIYIGQSSSKTTSLSKRLNDFYSHKVGNKGPHSGGYWLKLLTCLEKTYIYYAKTEKATELEFKMLMKFADKNAGKSFYEVENFSDFFPFANLKADIYKSHEIENAKNKRKKTQGNNV